MQPNNPNPIDPDFASEYTHIRKDVKTVILNNLIFIVLLVGLYFANQKFGFLAQLENLF